MNDFIIKIQTYSKNIWLAHSKCVTLETMNEIVMIQ